MDFVIMQNKIIAISISVFSERRSKHARQRSSELPVVAGET